MTLRIATVRLQWGLFAPPPRCQNGPTLACNCNARTPTARSNATAITASKWIRATRKTRPPT
eukprot:10787013-Lingulodinium_polyedra.AAC.1